MYKIRKVQFVDHPILKNLELDFSGPDGKAVDTVILAGANGTGKSTVLDALYSFASGRAPSMKLVLEQNDDLLKVSIKQTSRNSWEISAKDQKGYNVPLHMEKMCGIFSDVDINFHSKNLDTVTSLNIDSKTESRRSETDFPTEIKQLLIDIQALDDAALARAYKNAKENGESTEQLIYENRMSRFTNAFKNMFSGLAYSRIENDSGRKTILFQKHEDEVAIDALSSGEKQAVYGACFLLKDINATRGAFVFIDEPEISLHPDWQMKIMEYYKRIFTDEEGKQTSQIFAVTHSPFIIHNENRRHDKVIVLDRDGRGDIFCIDKPEYYKCDSVEVVKDAFSIDPFSTEKPTVYLEGRTDEMYFNKTLELFGLSVPFKFEWVGSIDSKGQEVNTGKEALNKAAAFLISRNLSIKNACLFDCDAKRNTKIENNVLTKSLPLFENDKGIIVGIENALIFGDIDIEPFKKQRIEVDGYGIEKRIPDFQKMACCKYICSLDVNRQREVLVNLKTIIEELVRFF